MKHTTKCEECGCKVNLIYGGQDFGWTGCCGSCLSILMFVSNDEVKHKKEWCYA